MNAAPHPDSDLRWNFRMGVLNGIAFRTVDTLINPNLVLVVFLSQLTDNPIILGLPASLWVGGFMLSQLWASGYIRRLARVLPVYRTMSLLRGLLWLGVVLMTAFVRSPAVLLAGFLIFLVAYPLIWGIGGLAFMEVISKVIPPRRRGPFFSWRMSLGGIVAVGAGALVNQVLRPDFPLGFPHNFALLFALAAMITVLGVLAFHAIREPASEPHPPEQVGLRGRWVEIRDVWRNDPNYRHYIKARVALLLAVGTAPLIVIFARSRYNLPLNAAAVFLIADTVTGLIAVALSGWFSTRFGNRLLALIAAVVGSCVFLMIVGAGVIDLPEMVVMPYFLVVFVLLAVHNGAGAISLFSLNLNIAPPERRPLYIGLGGTIIGLASYVGAGQGVIVAFAGYQTLFALAVGLMLFALWHLFRLYDPTESAT